MSLEHVRSLSGGINQTGVRAYNERLLLSVLQRNGALAGGELARRTGLSPQTTSVILRKLEQDGLLLRGDTVKGKGKVGKPSVPFDIRPDGIFSMGLKIGRRSADLLVLDLKGQVREQVRQTYDYPVPDTVFAFLTEGFATLQAKMPDEMRARTCGLGIAAPFELWNWHELAGAPAQDFEAWRAVDFKEEAMRITDLPVHMVNDATAACRAEHVFGIGREFRDYVYFFVGAFIGGGIVLDHAVFQGNQRNAGAFGPLPVTDMDGQPGLLIDLASIRGLELRLEGDGLDPRQLWQRPLDWSHLGAYVDPWLEQTADALARASVTACAIIDFEAMVFDGAMPTSVRHRLVNMVQARMGEQDMRGLIEPQIVEGMVGDNARGIGAAVGPIISQLLLDRSAALFDHG